MSDGRETSGMEDKSVSTADDLGDIHEGYFGDGAHWNAFAIEKLLTVLINNKIMAVRTMSAVEPAWSDKSDSYVEVSREREPPDKRYFKTYYRERSPQHRRYRHHHRHSSKHGHRDEHQKRSSSISKVQKWSEDLDANVSPEHAGHTDDETPRERSTERKSRKPREGYLEVDLESGRRKGAATKRRKRRKRKKGAAVKKKSSHVDPEDLPKRARWTIIITSGLLILTCMFLVGVTLRMAPVIDQMVRTKNEELMNSLNRNNNPAYYSSVNDPPPPA